MVKKAFLLSLDALVAIGLLLLLATFLASVSFTYSSPELQYQKLYYTGKDLLPVLENAKLQSVANLQTVQDYLNQGILTQADLNKTLLDVIGSFWAAGNKSYAANLTKEILNLTFPKNFGYEILMDNDSIYKKDTGSQNFVSRLNTIVSGYALGKPVSGHVASAYLARMSKNTSSFVYFGGYVGDGNITKFFELPSDANTTQAYLELDAGNNFSLWVNGNFAGNYLPNLTNMSASKWTICNSSVTCSNFTPGNNTININFTTNQNNYIGGGYLKITYNTSQPNTLPIDVSNYTAIEKYWFPGIQGIINLYSAFYIPGTLNKMQAYLHYLNNLTNVTVFFTIGNASIYESNATGEQNVTLNDSQLNSSLNLSGLSYNYLSNKTIPLRFGTKLNATVMQGNADVVLITDLSGSMDWMLNSSDTGVARECDDPDLYNNDTKRISLAKCLDKDFADIILNSTGNRVGLVGFYGDNYPPFKGRVIFHDLSTNETSLRDEIDDYFTQGGTCICCAENKAYEILDSQSNASRKKYVIVMSDGIPTHSCGSSKDDICTGTRTVTIGWGALDCAGGPEDCTGNDCDCAIQNSNWSSCRLHNNLNATVDAIGFGPVSDCPNANQTLQAIATCGNGSYYASTNATELKEIYHSIAQKIVNISYQAQTITIEGVGMNNTLYHDSYLEFNYTPVQYLEYGEVSLTFESERFGGNVTSPKNTSFYIPNDTKIVDTKVTSYSAQYWTDRLLVNSSKTGNWQIVYNLSEYGNDYTKLGDPYIVHIPVNLLIVGENNSVSIDTAITPENTTGASPDNRIIYSLGIKGIVGYGDVFSIEQNATQDAIQRLNQQLEGYNITAIEIETVSRSIASVPSLWGPAVLEIRVWS